ncbi:hypothetical protein C2G38_2229117 [Gigaspora rosea]|uniref:Uncharacterized protein n=1 Tax=Gigaspora rosea TaxID=44941 RepID=A0A397U4K2_9GLOM|nr:hypothetical protein C2G38_2229117 [Gigaspora rosea]
MSTQPEHNTPIVPASSDVPTISENKNSEKGQLIRYSSENYLTRLPTRDNIVAKNNESLSVILNNTLAKRKEFPFMAVDFEGSSEKIGEKNHYILRLYGFLINGQKAVVTLANLIDVIL